MQKQTAAIGSSALYAETFSFNDSLSLADTPHGNASVCGTYREHIPSSCLLYTDRKGSIPYPETLGDPYLAFEEEKRERKVAGSCSTTPDIAASFPKHNMKSIPNTRAKGSSSKKSSYKEQHGRNSHKDAGKLAKVMNDNEIEEKLRLINAKNNGLNRWMDEKEQQYTHDKERFQKKSEKLLNNESFASKTNSQASLGGVQEFQSHEESLELTLQRYVAKEILSKGEINLPAEERSKQERAEGTFRSSGTCVRKDEPLEEYESEEGAPAGLEELPEAEEHEEEGLPPPPCSTLNMPRRADAGESEGGEVSRREKLGGSISPILISNGKFKGRKLNIEKIVTSKSPR